MQPIPKVATDWLAAKGARVLDGEDSAWQEHADEVRALIYYSVHIDKPLLDQLPALEVIGKRGAGIDTVDLAEVTRRGIVVTNVGDGGNAVSVAEHAVTLLLAALRDVPRRDAMTRAGRFTERFTLPLFQELTGNRVGLIGMGRIGRGMAAILHHGFRCEVGYFDPYLEDPSTAGVAWAQRFTTTGALLEWSNIVIVAAPLTKETRDLVRLDDLRLLGPKGVLVIASRGGIVNESDLVTALRDGVIAFAATDAYDAEPPQPGHPFFGLDNMVLSPHIAGASERAREAAGLIVCDQVWALLHGEPAPTVDIEALL